MLLSKCSMCNNKNPRFTKEEEASGLSQLGIRISLGKIPLLGSILF